MNKSEQLEIKAKSLLDESLDDLDPAIARRLQQARYSALEKAKPRSFWSFYLKQYPLYLRLLLFQRVCISTLMRKL